jgi:hypothetical protein
MSDPIKPSEIAERRKDDLPPGVIASFNELIREKYSASSREARFLQGDVIKRMESKGLVKADIFKNHYLDVEAIYEEAGWEVVFEKDDHAENSEFIFKSKTPNTH